MFIGIQESGEKIAATPSPAATTTGVVRG